jgi:hypothetical protein
MWVFFCIFLILKGYKNVDRIRFLPQTRYTVSFTDSRACQRCLQAHQAESTSTGSNGVQIIPPHDSGIAKSIEAHLDIPDESWKPEDIIAASDLYIDQTEKLKEAYIETLARHPVAG